MKDDFCYYSTMSKTQLALLYFPNMVPTAARRKLNKWIVYNKLLYQELMTLGYSMKQTILTPAQVRLIIGYLGEP